jgi:threonine dehydratase
MGGGIAMNNDLIRAASDRLRGAIRRTPLLSSPYLDELAGRRVLVKPECLQHTGSFKARGAWSAISAMDPELRKNGVLAFSSGNHAQGVAWAAREHGIPAVILMPSDAPALKIANTKALGARVHLFDRATDDRDAMGKQLAEDLGLSIVKPFDDPQVIAGQGTVGLEIAEQAGEIGVTEAEVLVCCGGGGLTSGIAVALNDAAPNMRVRPVEPEGFDDVARSLTSGTLQSNAALTGSICDAVLTPAPGDLTLPLMQRHCGPGLTVSDDEALQAMALAFLRLKLVAEPGGAIALAAALRADASITADTVIAVISGGNVDPMMFTRALIAHNEG